MSDLISGRVSFEASGRPILRDVEIALRDGESVAIVGPNGAGKTTLIRLLANVLTPNVGGLALRGVPYRDRSRRSLALSIAYVPQVRPARVPLRVRDVVLLGRYPHGRAWSVGYEARDFEAMTRALDVVDSSDLADRTLTELSGGERQAVYIAAALAQDTEVLLLDEPTTYLDPGHQRRIAHLMARLTHQEGRALVFASHDLNLAYAVADRVIALEAGRVVASGPTLEVLDAGTIERLYDAPFHLSYPSPSGRPIATVDFSGQPE